MSEEQVVVRVRGPRRRAEAIQQLVREFESSGQTRVEFCRSRALAVSTLDRYLRKHRRGEERNSQAAGAGLVPVEVLSGRSAAASSRSALWLELPNGWRVEVGSGFEAAALRRLLQVLEQA
jgi:hypothetical protein